MTALGPRRCFPEKDAMLMRFGRALFREHSVSSALWAQVVKEFGRQGTVEIMALVSRCHH